ncbi:NAD(P)-dependent oxidoreductase [candidate division KSB1 bacterium]|nr:NAD(P)-dependent oxidoreductase [candidate division KSB1 bacterium]
MKRILITGINGLLGQRCFYEFKDDFEIIGLDLHSSSIVSPKVSYYTIDLTQRNQIKEVLLHEKPDYILNMAAFTNVDGAENQRELCWKVNVESVEHLAYFAHKIGAKLVHVSTDYVFDGKSGPYRETDVPAPLGYYGKSKLAGENALRKSDATFAILRTMVLFGTGIDIRLNFVTWLIQTLKEKKEVTIVDDQFGNPTLADDLTKAIRCVIERDKWDLFHIGGLEIIDRYHFAVEIARYFDLDPKLINRTTTTALNQQVPRPLKSGFILEKAITELNHHPMTIETSLKILKKQLKKAKLL